ncbi:MAG: hypothetical protein R3D02_13110 [Hyphomicrobiales bacterium]
MIMTGGGCGLNGTLKGLFEREALPSSAIPARRRAIGTIEEWAELGIGAGILPAGKLSDQAAGPRPLVCNDGRPACFTFQWVWDASARGKAHLSRLIDHVRQEVPTLIAAGRISRSRLPNPAQPLRSSFLATGCGAESTTSPVQARSQGRKTKPAGWGARI